MATAKKVVSKAVNVAAPTAAKVPTGFTQVGGPADTTYPKYALTPAGTVLVDDGVYLGAVESRFGGYGYPFRMKDGTRIHLNSAGQLALRMESVEAGTHCHIVYCGTEVLKKGTFKGKDCHQFQVSVGGVEVGAVTSAPQHIAEDLDISL
jgi:hypothetical protein